MSLDAPRPADDVAALTDLLHAQEIALLGSWLFDSSTGITLWSDGMHAIFGSDPSGAPISRDVLFEMIHPDDRRRVRAEYARMARTQTASEVDYRLVIDPQTMRVVHSIARPVPERPGCFRGTLQDMTRAWTAEQALRESEERLRRIIADARSG